MYSIAPFCPHYALLKNIFSFLLLLFTFSPFFLFTRQRKLFRTDRFPVRTQVHLCRRRRRPGRGECCQTGELYLPFIGISLSLRVPLSLSCLFFCFRCLWGEILCSILWQRHPLCPILRLGIADRSRNRRQTRRHATVINTKSPDRKEKKSWNKNNEEEKKTKGM